MKEWGGDRPKHQQKVSVGLEEAPNLRTMNQNSHWSPGVRIKAVAAAGWNLPGNLPLAMPEYPLKGYTCFKVKCFIVIGV